MYTEVPRLRIHLIKGADGGGYCPVIYDFMRKEPEVSVLKWGMQIDS